MWHPTSYGWYLVLYRYFRCKNRECRRAEKNSFGFSGLDAEVLSQLPRDIRESLPFVYRKNSTCVSQSLINDLVNTVGGGHMGLLPFANLLQATQEPCTTSTRNKRMCKTCGHLKFFGDIKAFHERSACIECCIAKKKNIL